MRSYLPFALGGALAGFIGQIARASVNSPNLGPLAGYAAVLAVIVGGGGLFLLRANSTKIYSESNRNTLESMQILMDQLKDRLQAANQEVYKLQEKLTECDGGRQGVEKELIEAKSERDALRQQILAMKNTIEQLQSRPDGQSAH